MKKNFLFGLLAIGLAGFGFGGISLASTITFTFNDGETPTTIKTTNDAGKLSTLPTCSGVWYKDGAIDGSGHVDKDKIAQIFTSTVFSGDATYLCNTKYVAEVSGVQYETFLDAHAVANGGIITLLSKITTPYILGQNEILQLLKPKPEGYSSPTSLTVSPPEGPYLVNSSTSGLITTYTVIEGIIKYTNSNNVVSYLSDIPNAFSDGTYKLLQDVNKSQRMTPSTFAYNVTLDLNGHTILSTATDFAIYLNRAGSEGSHRIFNVIDTSTNKGGKIIATGITSEDSTDAMISLAGKYNDVTVGEGVTLSGGCIAVLSENQTLSVDGIINGGDDFAIATNGSNTKNPIITINAGSQLFSKAAAIYFPSEGTLTINGGKISGAFGVVTRAGTTAISNDVIFDVSGEGDTTVGDQKDIQLPKGKAVIMDVAANYPGSIDATFTVNNASLGNAYLVVGTKDDYNGYDVSIKSGENVIPLILTKDGTSAKITEPGAIEGYQWYNVVDENNKYVFDFSQIITGDTVIEPIINQYTVKFDANVEGVNNPTDQTVNHGATASEPEVLNTGNILLGWYLNDNKFDFTTPITTDITLTGKWEAMTLAGDAKIEDETEEGTGMVVEAEEPNLSEGEESDIESKLGSSNSTAELQGATELNVYYDSDGNGEGDGEEITKRVNFTKAVLVRIPVNSGSSVKVKVKHNQSTSFDISGLTTNSGDCENGIAKSNVYNGGNIPVTSGYAEIYTCSASTFVAYTETANQSSSSTSGGGGGGGSSKKDETKVETGTTDTGDIVDAETTGAEEGTNEENKPLLTAEEEKVAVEKFGQEQIDAYKWALENGITTMKTVEAARLDQPLTRAELAKMMVVYIQKVVEKDPVLALDVTYVDVDESLGDLAGYIKLAYQYQIMGINADGTPIEKFNPHGLVTRGEYATVFSRVLFGSKFNKEGADFYTNHLAALEKAGILTNITPTIKEIRGWVMLMMYRSSQNNEKIQTVAAETEEVNEEEKAEIPANEETVIEETAEETTVTEENNTEVNEDASSNKTEEDTSEETTENSETSTEPEATENTGDTVSE